MRSRPLYIFCFLTFLFATQGFALLEQLREGFRPFGAAPHRVPFSWDMFSVRIERCDVIWSPPLLLPEGPLYRLRQKGPRLEWDFTLDRETDYRDLVNWTCSNFGKPFHASLLCFTPEGKVVPSAVECR